MQDKYTVGDFWLEADNQTGIFKIWWYDAAKRQTRRKTTGTRDFQQAVELITAHHLAHLEPKKEIGISVRQVSLKYWEEHAKKLVSTDSCRVSMDKLNRFLDTKETGESSFLADDWTGSTTLEFIKWMKANPSHYTKMIRNKKGEVIDTVQVTRKLTDNTINRTLDDVRAAFRFCMDRPPIIRGIKGVEVREGRKKPTLSTDQIKTLFKYAYQSPDRKHLQNYLITAFTTLARPEAILDISVSPERSQVEWDYRLLHLNPSGRKQNKKFRPIVPINDYLLQIIQESHDLYLRAKADPEITTSGFLVEYKSKPLSGIRQTWNKAKEALGWPMVRDWDAKMIRHTMAKYLRAQGVPWPELQGHMGHSIKGMTEEYAEYDPKYLGHVQAEITRFLAQVFDGLDGGCVPIASHSETSVISIKGKR